MAFAGIKDSAELADLLVYMRKLADSPARVAEVGGSRPAPGRFFGFNYLIYKKFYLLTADDQGLTWRPFPAPA